MMLSPKSVPSISERTEASIRVRAAKLRAARGTPLPEPPYLYKTPSVTPAAATTPPRRARYRN